MISIAYAEHMAEAQKKNPLGPSGKTVADNIRRLRGEMQYVKLAAVLERLGRPIPTLGLRKIESYERRVDVDDLVALSVALGVSPITLLLEPQETPADAVPVTAYPPDDIVRGDLLWNWLTARDALPQNKESTAALGPMTRMMFGARAWPSWIQDGENRAEELRRREERFYEENPGSADGDD